MQAKLLETRYSYAEVLLPTSQARVSGIIVIMDGKIYRTHGNMDVVLPDNQRFTFALTQPHQEITASTQYKEPRGSTNDVPAGVSAETIMEEFKTYALKDING